MMVVTLLNITRRTQCRLCYSTNLEKVIPIRPSPIADAFVTQDQLSEPQEYYPLDLFLCNDCAHLQHLDIVNPEILFRNYTYKTSSSLGLVDHYKKYADEVINNYKIEPGSLIVEIGSNDGSLLNFFKNNGMQVLGVDPARQIAREATEKGITTFAEYFTVDLAEEIRKKYGGAQVIAANNVFAHADELADIVTGVRTLLSDDGIFVFEVSYLVDIIDRFLFDTVYHEHVSYHSVAPLVKFFNSLGMELFDVVRVGSKGGSIRGIVQCSPEGKRKKSQSINEFLALEQKKGMDGPEVYKKFYADIEVRKDNLNKKLDDIIQNNGKLVGYGASTTVTTLSNHFLISKKFDYFVDDNPVKQSKFTPGAHIPVYPSDRIYQDIPDYIVILAWQYAEPIMKRHKKYIEQGGKFIIPLPDLKIVG